MTIGHANKHGRRVAGRAAQAIAYEGVNNQVCRRQLYCAVGHLNLDTQTLKDSQLVAGHLCEVRGFRCQPYTHIRAPHVETSSTYQATPSVASCSRQDQNTAATGITIQESASCQMRQAPSSVLHHL